MKPEPESSSWQALAALIGMVVFMRRHWTTLRQTMMKERTAQLSTLVVLAQSALEKLHEQETAGKITREEAQKQGKLVIGSFRKDELYFFVRGYSDDVNLVHPNPKRVGIVDAKGGKKPACATGPRWKARRSAP